VSTGKRYALPPNGSEELAGIDRGHSRQPLDVAGTQVRWHGCSLAAVGAGDDGDSTCSAVGLAVLLVHSDVVDPDCLGVEALHVA
jgi:hypothetical protein